MKKIEGGVKMDEIDRILETLKPTYRDGLFLLAGVIIDEFGVKYVRKKCKEFNEELARMVAEKLKEYEKE